MGIILPPTGSFYRRLGRGLRAASWRQVGCGASDKSGRHDDFIDYRCPTLCTVWLLRGSGSYEDENGKVVSLTAGDCFQRWPGRLHSTRIVADSGWYEVHINIGDELPQILDSLGVLDARRTVWHLGLDPNRLRRWMELRTALGEADDHQLPALCIRAQGLLVDAQASDLPTRASSDPIAEACRHLAADLAGRDDLESFCASLGLDYETFRKRFRREIGLSPGQYRIRRRMERACALLSSSCTPIAAIASDLGYTSQFDFSTQFRRHIGVSPRRYREQPAGPQ